LSPTARLPACTPLSCAPCPRDSGCRFCSTFWAGPLRWRLTEGRSSRNEAAWRIERRSWPRRSQRRCGSKLKLPQKSDLRWWLPEGRRQSGARSVGRDHVRACKCGALPAATGKDPLSVKNLPEAFGLVAPGELAHPAGGLGLGLLAHSRPRPGTSLFVALLEWLFAFLHAPQTLLPQRLILGRADTALFAPVESCSGFSDL
jgi:hypothetical protein